MTQFPINYIEQIVFGLLWLIVKLVLSSELAPHLSILTVNIATHIQQYMSDQQEEQQCWKAELSA